MTLITFNTCWVLRAGMCSLMVFAVRTLAGEAAFQSLPVPIMVEGTSLRSAMFIRAAVQYYTTPIDQFLTSAKDSRELGFKRMIEAIRSGNLEQFREALSKRPEDATTRQNAKPLLDMYQQGFSDLEKPFVTCQFLMGSKALFIVEGRSRAPSLRGKLLRAAVSLKRGASGSFEGIYNDAVDMICLDIMRQTAESSGAYAPYSQVSCKYDCRVPVSPNVDTNEHPVRLQFNGAVLDFDLFGEEIPLADESLKFYREAYVSLKTNGLPAYVKYLTEASRERLEKWLGRLTPDQRDAYRNRMTTQRRVRFLLQAEPVFVVFYTTTPSPNAPLSYDYVVRESPQTGFKLANFVFQSWFDDFIKSKHLFLEPILEPILRGVSQGSHDQGSGFTR